MFTPYQFFYCPECKIIYKADHPFACSKCNNEVGHLYAYELTYVSSEYDNYINTLFTTFVTKGRIVFRLNLYELTAQDLVIVRNSFPNKFK